MTPTDLALYHLFVGTDVAAKKLSEKGGGQLIG